MRSVTYANQWPETDIVILIGSELPVTSFSATYPGLVLVAVKVDMF